MLFQDLSCIAENTLSNHLTSGIYDMMDIQWASIVSVGRSGKINLDASLRIKEISDALCIEFIHENKLDFLGIKETCRTYVYKTHNFLVKWVRTANTYETFFVFAKNQIPFFHRDVSWFSLYINKSYSNLLLNHELIQNNDYMSSVLDNTEDSILVFNQMLDIVSYNQIAGDYLKGPSSKNQFTLYDLPFENLDLIKESVETVFMKEEKIVLQKVTLLQKEQNLIFTVTFSPLRDSKKRVAGVVAIGLDITKLQLMQYEIEQLERYGMLGEIALGISHDVKNPLMNIKSCAGYLKKHHPQAREQDYYLDLIAQEISRINTIVDQLMSFGNVYKENEYLFININDVLCNCKQIIERQKMYRQVAILTSFAHDIPLVKAKNSDMQQIFINIMLNALQSIERDGTLNIISSFNATTSEITIIISDTGKGIGDVDMKKLCTPYYTTKANGKGLGLFLVKRTLERYHGTIRFSSKPEKGTVCTISIPGDYVCLNAQEEM